MLLSPDNPDSLHGNQSFTADQSIFVNIENNLEQTYTNNAHHYNQIEPNYLNHQYTSNQVKDHQLQSSPDQLIPTIQFELAMIIEFDIYITLLYKINHSIIVK